jgi:two-component system chemotaxis response regulator CheY
VTTKLLLVDDAMFMRLRASTVLKKEFPDCTITEAKNGAEAVDAYKVERPDLVLLDITMPMMDGLQALEQILALDETARVVMYTAIEDKVNTIKAKNMGAKDFVSKREPPERLVAAVRRVLGRE